MQRTLSALLLMLLLFGTSSILHGENWPAWRGPNGTGISTDGNMPTQWSPTENVRWKVPLPGPGNSTPIVWGDHVFLTQALDGGSRRALMALNRKTGAKRWQRELTCSVKETTHRQNPPCSSSPVTDGKTVYAQFGSAGVVAYDFNGKQLWHRDLGKVLHRFGNGSSPMLYKDLLIVFHGPGIPSALMGLDKKTGRTKWRSDEVAINSNIFGSWGTPVVVRAAGRDELVMPLPGAKIGSPGWMKAYNPMNGKMLWRCDGLGNEVYATPTINSEKNIIVGISGHNGPTMAVRPGGSGDVTGSHRLWKTTRKNPQRIGSGIIDKGLLYVADATGVMQCFDVKSGELIWKQRLGGNLWGSITMADAKLYVTNLEGDTFVVRPGRNFKLLSKNQIRETTYAAMAPSNGNLFLRTYKHLYCIARRN